MKLNFNFNFGGQSLDRKKTSMSELPDRFRDAARPPAETEDPGRGCHPAVCNQAGFGTTQGLFPTRRQRISGSTVPGTGAET